jgi:hypothetical protein
LVLAQDHLDLSDRREDRQGVVVDRQVPVLLLDL